MMQVWTFVIVGGSEFRVTIPNNPRLVHFGGRTLWKFVGTETKVQELASAFRTFDAAVEYYTETETADMTAEREALAGRTLKAKWSEELATDLKNFHGIDPT